MLNKLKEKIRKKLGLDIGEYSLVVELLSGIVVAIALIPESISFSFVAGIDPIIGIYSSFLMGLIAGLFGGRPAMITGATGAVAVVYADLVNNNPVEYLFLAVILAGVIQIVFGLIGLSKFSKIIPYPVILGFLNGLALVILLAQKEMFMVPQSDELLKGLEMIAMIVLTLTSLLITMYLPKVIKKVPSALIAIITVTILSLLISEFTNINVYTISDMAGKSLEAGLPTLKLNEIPFTNIEAYKIVFPFALSAALVGLIESLLTLNVLDEITDTRGDEKQESIAQGLANVVTGMFGGMGGCAMIGQSNININNGARTYISTIFAAVILLVLVVVLSSVIDIIPLAALTGIMLVVVIKTFAWETIIARGRFTYKDLFVIVLVALMTLVYTLAIAVIVGVIVSALFFAWEKGEKIDVITNDSEEEIIYVVNGLIFFSSTKKLLDLIKVDGNKNVVVDLKDAKVVDSSAVKALEDLRDRCEKKGISLRLKNVNKESEIKILRNQRGKLL